jgi:hypothetical protein
MSCIVTKVASVRPLGENLSVVTVEGVDHEVVANRLDDGRFRWREGQPCVYVPEEVVVPDDVLKQRGYWNEDKGIGLLGGKKGNRVKMRRFGPEDERIESRGLLFQIDTASQPGKMVLRSDDNNPDCEVRVVEMGEDVSDFFGITGA